MWYKDAANSVHSALQKGLHFAEGVAGGIATAKGIYEAGKTVLSVGRAIAPCTGYAIISRLYRKCSSLRGKRIKPGATLRDLWGTLMLLVENGQV